MRCIYVSTTCLFTIYNNNKALYVLHMCIDHQSTQPHNLKYIYAYNYIYIIVGLLHETR